jgi:hypothetical protein
MSFIIRRLAKNERKTWEDFIITSPQATLFHTWEWNRMISETDKDSSPEYIIYERDNVILGGITLQHSKGKVELPGIGYNGPLFSASINYEHHYKTSKGYGICTELIKACCRLSKKIAIKNHPEIWDVRAFTFHDWNIETSYTHILQGNSQIIREQKFNEELLNKIKESQCAITPNITNEYISKYCAAAIGDRNLHVYSRRNETETLKKRIRWLLDNGLGKLVLLTNKSGEEMGMLLLLFSDTNSTLYVGKIVSFLKGIKSNIVPLFIWHIDQAYGTKFQRIDLGESETMEISNQKDEIGSILTPIFITRFPNG